MVASSATRSASSSPARPRQQAAAEPGRRLDPPDRHPERRGDLAVVGHRPHGRAELGVAQERRGHHRDRDAGPQRDHLRPGHLDLADREAAVVGRQRDRAGLAAAGRPQQVHEPEQDERQPQRGHRLDQRVPFGQGRAEQQPVAERHHPGERHAHQPGHPAGNVRVDQGPGDQGAHRADGTEREVHHAGGPVQDDQAHPGQGVHATQGQTGHDERLEVLPARHPRPTPGALGVAPWSGRGSAPRQRPCGTPRSAGRPTRSWCSPAPSPSGRCRA